MAPANRRSTAPFRRDPAVARRHPLQERPIDRERPADDRRARSHPRAGGPPDLPQYDGARKSSTSAPIVVPAPTAPITAAVFSRTFPRLAERQHQQRRHACPAASSRCSPSAAGLMAEPELLILDEPSLGLSPLLVEELFALIKDHQHAGHRRASGRAERGPEPRGGASRLYPRQWPVRARGKRQPSCATDPEIQARLSRNVTVGT